MDFKKQKPIYLQIADTLCERITVMRTYDHLQNAEIIYNRRGVGYFVEPKAGDRIRKMHRQEFINDELPYFVQRMNMLGFTWEDLINESKQN